MTVRILLISMSILLALPASAETSIRLAVIVHPERIVDIGLGELAQIYLRRRRYWPDRSPIVPVNRDSRSPVREAFARRVLAAPTSSFDLYWNRQYYHGVLPPLTLASDEAVLRFVAVERNAIGYVLESAVDDTVRVLLHFDTVSSEAK